MPKSMWAYTKLVPKSWKHTTLYNVFACIREFPSMEQWGPDTFQHENALVHNVQSMKTWFAKFDEKEWFAQSPDFNPNEHLWD